MCVCELICITLTDTNIKTKRKKKIFKYLSRNFNIILVNCFNTIDISKINNKLENFFYL